MLKKSAVIIIILSAIFIFFRSGLNNNIGFKILNSNNSVGGLNLLESKKEKDKREHTNSKKLIQLNDPTSENAKKNLTQEQILSQQVKQLKLSYQAINKQISQKGYPDTVINEQLNPAEHQELVQLLIVKQKLALKLFQTESQLMRRSL